MQKNTIRIQLVQRPKFEDEEVVRDMEIIHDYEIFDDAPPPAEDIKFEHLDKITARDLKPSEVEVRTFIVPFQSK